MPPARVRLEWAILLGSCVVLAAGAVAHGAEAPAELAAALAAATEAIQAAPDDPRGYARRAALYAAAADGRRAPTQAQLASEIEGTRPLSVLMAEKVAALRAWASGRTVPAD